MPPYLMIWSTLTCRLGTAMSLGSVWMIQFPSLVVAKLTTYRSEQYSRGWDHINTVLVAQLIIIVDCGQIKLSHA